LKSGEYTGVDYELGFELSASSKRVFANLLGCLATVRMMQPIQLGSSLVSSSRIRFPASKLPSNMLFKFKVRAEKRSEVPMIIMLH